MGASFKALYRGKARVADSPILTTVWAHPADLHPWPHDPAEARRLLASRGFRDTDGDGILDRGGKPLTLELSTNAGNQLRRDAVVLIQEQLERAGIAVTPAVREPSAQRVLPYCPRATLCFTLLLMPRTRTFSGSFSGG